MKEDKLKKLVAPILAKLKKGEIPWIKKYDSVGFMKQINTISGNRYNGFNQFILSLVTQEKGYKSAEWLTFKQAQQLGGTIRKGEKGTSVLYSSKYIPKDVKNDKTLTEKEKEGKSIFFLKSYSVFNLTQTEGIDYDNYSEEKEVIKAESLIPKNCNIITDKTNVAGFIPIKDIIKMPSLDSFNTNAHYYDTLFHEIAHWTGHKSRFARAGVKGSDPHGEGEYSTEELVAEMTSSLIMGEVDLTYGGIPSKSESYLKNWIQTIEDNPNMIVRASSQTGKAYDFIMNCNTIVKRR